MARVASARYEILPSLLLGFHGTDEATAERVLSGKDGLRASENEYDWLGHGIYFWEYSPQRALEFARQALKDKKSSRGKIKKPAVIGAVIDPGVCLNFLEASALSQLKAAYDVLTLIEDKLPKNRGGNDRRARYLDCAVVEMVHKMRELPGGALRTLSKEPQLPHYDTVRGAFWEGADLYPDAGFKEKNHIQICVRNSECIKGYFRVLP